MSEAIEKPKSFLEELELCNSDSPPIEITEEQEDRLLFLLADNELDAMAIKQLIAFQICIRDRLKMPEQRQSPINSHNFKQLTETSELCADLAAKIQGDFEGKLSELLTLMASYYRVKAQISNPKGKRQRKISIQAMLANGLIRTIKENHIDIPLSINPDSDLSRLFRMCCEIMSVKAPRNTSFYLKPAIQGPQIRELWSELKKIEKNIRKIASAERIRI
ncbi:MAG: hypothetical protein RQ826_09500 [Xanthomonadales bacterium]|nr:hypothetical protein [Xanthomonadales bacterium]